MGLFGWLFGGRKPSKSQGKKLHKAKGGKEARLRRDLAAQGINIDLAYCTECGEWYNTRNRAALDLHAH